MRYLKKPDLLCDPPVKALAVTTAPMIIGITAYMSFNLADSYFIAQLGIEQLAAIGYSFPIVIVFLNLAIGLSIGTTSVLSRLLGEKKVEETRSVTTLSIYIAGITGSLLALLGILFIEPLFKILGATPSNIEIIQDYMFYSYIAMGIRMCSISISSIFKATGNTLIPSLSILITALINLILDPFLIFGLAGLPRLGIAGAGIATLIATSLAFTFEFYCCFFHYSYADFKINWSVLPFTKIKEILTISIPASISNALNPVSISFGNWLLSPLGEPFIAGYGVASKIQTFLLIPILALSAAFGPFVGQNFSAGKKERIQHAYKYSFFATTLYFVILFVVLFFTIESIGELFTEQKITLEVIKEYTYMTSLSLIGYAFVIIASSGLNAVNKPFKSLMIIALRTTILLVPLSFVLFHFFQDTGFWVSCAMTNLVVGVISWIIVKKTF